MARIHPVLLSGGAGTRLWPLSRALYPKQLMPLVSSESLLQETVRRVADRARFAEPTLVSNEDHRFIIAEQLRAIGITPKAILLEPEGRNTAPAVAAAALALDDADALLLVLPSDHVIRDRAAFLATVEGGIQAAEEGALVIFGVVPDKPETGYGYIRRGRPYERVRGAYRVRRFVEKPDERRAARYVSSGDYYWNAGMFLFRARDYLSEIERLQPAMLSACRAAVAKSRKDLDFLRLDREAFSASPSISIDYAVMEHTQKAVVVPLDAGWSDVGAWSALWDLGTKDDQGNVVVGSVIAEGTRNSYLRADARIVAALGIEDLVVVATEDAVLVATRERAQDIRAIVERLKAEGRSETQYHPTVHRPWGTYKTVDAGDRFQVKRITVKPHASLSLQRHRHRAEHWVVVSGVAEVTRGDETLRLEANQSTYIPVGTVHRLANPLDEPLHLIEVQSGAQLSEDDIERLEDRYGRAAGPGQKG
ncbi:MAG: mannose-1-phosphate guanylyltransferase/mannose-6-phosphate isomerase [Alphaproteobacteria bacterium]